MARPSIVNDIARGDTAALDRFYREYRERILAVARRIVGDEWDAEEVLQDVVWTVYRKADSFRGDAAFSSWVYRVTQNAARMLLRKRRRVPLPVEAKDIEGIAHMTPDVDIAVRPEELALQRFAVERMDAELQRQDSMNRELFEMMDVEGRTKEDVAEVLGLSISALKARLHRVRKALRRAAEGGQSVSWTGTFA